MIKRDDALNSKQDLKPAKSELGPLATSAVAVPGQYELTWPAPVQSVETAFHHHPSGFHADQLPSNDGDQAPRRPPQDEVADLQGTARFYRLGK